METMTLNISEIIDLAKAAGLKVTNIPNEDDQETEFTIADCPKDGLDNENGTRSHYRLIAYLSEYPEEGSYALGKAIL